MRTETANLLDEVSSSAQSAAPTVTSVDWVRFSQNAAAFVMLAGSSVATVQGIDSFIGATVYDNEAHSQYVRAFAVAKETAELAAVGRIRELAQRPAEWKEPGSKPSSQAGKLDAEKFARLHLSEGLVGPRINLDPDGEYSFYWRTSRIEMNVVIPGDGTYSFFAWLRSGESFEGDELPLDRPLPRQIIEALADLVS